MSDLFFEKYCNYEVIEDDIDDYISDWHDSGPEETRELHEYLGMTWQEYGEWLRDESVLLSLREKRNSGL